MPPKVVVFLNSLDIEHSANCRIGTRATDITAEGFTIHIDTYADSILWSAGATWLAYPSDGIGINITSGRVSTNDTRSWEQHCLKNSKTITFENPILIDTPRVFMALNSLDIDRSRNVRILMSSKNVTGTGMEWHLDSWFDSILYEAGASYIAL